MNTTTSAYPRLGDEYCIGPHCGAIYWNCNATQPRFYHYVKPNQGPCMSYPLSKRKYAYETVQGQRWLLIATDLLTRAFPESRRSQRIHAAPVCRGPSRRTENFWIMAAK
jgi:hypothetical protein